MRRFMRKAGRWAAARPYILCLFSECWNRHCERLALPSKAPFSVGCIACVSVRAICEGARSVRECALCAWVRAICVSRASFASRQRIGNQSHTQIGEAYLRCPPCIGKKGRLGHPRDRVRFQYPELSRLIKYEVAP